MIIFESMVSGAPIGKPAGAQQLECGLTFRFVSCVHLSKSLLFFVHSVSGFVEKLFVCLQRIPRAPTRNPAGAQQLECGTA